MRGSKSKVSLVFVITLIALIATAISILIWGIPIRQNFDKISECSYAEGIGIDKLFRGNVTMEQVFVEGEGSQVIYWLDDGSEKALISTWDGAPSLIDVGIHGWWVAYSSSEWANDFAYYSVATWVISAKTTALDFAVDTKLANADVHTRVFIGIMDWHRVD